MTLTIHATAVSIHEKAVVIFGPSGSGKSSLALQLMAFGADLLADDQVHLSVVGNDLVASCPASIMGLIEARYVGVLNASPAPPTPVALAVDLGQTEESRVPEHRTVTWLNHTIPLLWGVKNPHFPASLLQMLKAGRSLR
jgi:HPr kinase/phosphorylase